MDEPDSSPGEAHGPWRRLNSREVYSNAWIRVREDEVLRPDGNPGIYGVVEIEAALGVIALTDDGQVYLVGQYRYPTGTYSWEIISGNAEPGEDFLTGAMRELKEEAGLTAREWLSLGYCELSNSVTNQVGYLWIARGLTDGVATPDGTEELEVKTVPLEEAVRMAQDGRIYQTFSMAGIYRAWHRLEGLHAAT